MPSVEEGGLHIGPPFEVTLEAGERVIPLTGTLLREEIEYWTKKLAEKPRNPQSSLDQLKRLREDENEDSPSAD
jgi:hypothetical protein